MVGGYTNDPTGNSDVWLFRTDASGNMVWEDIIGYPDLVEIAYTLEPAFDGDFILAGMKEDESENTGGGLIVKVDSNGLGCGFTYGVAGEYTYLYDAVSTIYNEVVGVGHQTNAQAGADVYEVGTFQYGLFK